MTLTLRLLPLNPKPKKISAEELMENMLLKTFVKVSAKMVLQPLLRARLDSRLLWKLNLSPNTGDPLIRLGSWARYAILSTRNSTE